MAIFSQAQLKKLVAETMPADAKPGEKIVVGTVDSSGAQVVVDLKLTTRWTVQGVYRHDWSGDNTAAATVIGRWP